MSTSHSNNRKRQRHTEYLENRLPWPELTTNQSAFDNTKTNSSDSYSFIKNNTTSTASSNITTESPLAKSTNNYSTAVKHDQTHHLYPMSIQNNSIHRYNHNKDKIKPTVMNTSRPNESINTQLWIHKYEPTNSNDLCISTTKRNQVRSWLLDCFSSPSLQQDSTTTYTDNSRNTTTNIPSKLLILAGSPGIGKSTMIKVLFQEIINTYTNNNNSHSTNNNKDYNHVHGNILQWNDSYTSGEGARFDSITISTTRNNHVTSLHSFQNFLTSVASYGRHTLDFISHDDIHHHHGHNHNNNNKHTTDNNSLDEDYNDECNHNLKNNQLKTNNVSKKISSSWSMLPSFSHTQQKQDTGVNTNTKKNKQTIVLQGIDEAHTRVYNHKNLPTLVLIDEIPCLHTPQQQAQFRYIMSNYLVSTSIPTVFIFSDVVEGQFNPKDLEQLIPSNILYSSLVHTISINPVSHTMMIKCLSHILHSESTTTTTTATDLIQYDSNGKVQKRRSKSKSKSKIYSIVDDIASTSHGDLRHAIMTLQYKFSHMNNTTTMTNGNHSLKQQQKFDNDYTNSTESSSASSASLLQRDEKLSTFHAIGKLLYAKRKESNQDVKLSRNNNESTHHSSTLSYLNDTAVAPSSRPPLEFVPETVMDQSDMTQDLALYYLGYHSPSFFSDCIELSDAFGYFSDAIFLLDQTYKGIKDSHFPSGYVSSLAGRAVAHTNKHPAPSKFHSLKCPEIYNVMKQRKKNDSEREQLCHRLYNHGVISLDSYIISSGSNSTFGTEVLPLVKSIIPNDLSCYTNQIHGETSDEGMMQMAVDDILFTLEQQMEVLKDDDIVDDDDD